MNTEDIKPDKSPALLICWNASAGRNRPKNLKSFTKTRILHRMSMTTLHKWRRGYCNRFGHFQIKKVKNHFGNYGF